MAKDTDRAFEELYREHSREVIRLCVLYLGDVALAEDAAQETFFKAYKALGTFRGGSDIRTWLTRIAVNTCKDILRRKRPVPLDELPHEPSYTDERDSSLSLSAAVTSLPPKLREVIILYYYQELSVAQAARLLGISESAAAKRLERGRARLRGILGEDFNE